MPTARAPWRASTTELVRARVGLAWRAGLAAALAWYLGSLLPGAPGEYPFYAPLGALLVSYPTVVDSVSNGVRALAATLIGVALGAGALTVAGPDWWAVALVVLIAIALGGLPHLAAQRDTVPMAALFTVLIGSTDPSGYVAGYIGQTVLGVAVGLAVHLALPPPTRIRHASDELDRLRDGVCEHLEEMAGVLAEQWPPERDEWTKRRHDFEPLIAATRAAVTSADASRRANLRARRYRRRGQEQFASARTLEQIAVLVRDISTVLAHTAWAERTVLVLDPELRRPIADAMTALASALRTSDLRERAPACDAGCTDQVSAARAALRRVTDRLDGDRSAAWEDTLAASGIVLHLRRCLDAVDDGPSGIAPVTVIRAPEEVRDPVADGTATADARA
ncbi:FUSC family protein [Pseudonocardia nematodicida]|uniref:FUSC family protein n=1 Tax=Pseudonocardia nematodicida TaxID=1206997 RepID=A0ABV1KAV7_9PSEU